MKHYLSYIEQAIKENWDKPALTNYGANTLNYSDVAINIAKLHIIFEKSGIKKGDHIAICARSSAEWCVAFLAIASYQAVAVPLLPDFMPESVATLTKASDSRLLFVDKGVLSGMLRDNVLEKFNTIDGFIGIVDIATCDAVEEYKSTFKLKQDDVDAAFDERYPCGMSADDVELNNGNLDELAVISYKTPAELCGDITESGICLTGGSAQLYGLDKFISEQTGVPCYVAEDPASCVAIGAGRVLEDIKTYRDVLYDYRRGDYYEA